MDVTISLKPKFWVYEASRFGIESYGKTRLDADRCFGEDFAVLYKHIASERDDRLTEDARSVKRAFQETVEDVTPEP